MLAGLRRPVAGRPDAWRPDLGRLAGDEFGSGQGPGRFLHRRWGTNP